MIGVVATLRVQEGKGAEFESVFLELSTRVRQNEPGALMYQLTRSRAAPGAYKVLELYADQDALDHHRQTDYFKELGRKMGPFMAGRSDIEVLDGVD